MSEDAVKKRMNSKQLLIVLVISLGSFMAGLDVTIVNIALPTISEAFNVSTVTVSWVINAYLIVLVSLLLASARMGDKRGYKKIFLIGFIVFTVGSICCGFAPSIEFLIISRVLQAIGGAIIAALGSVMVTSYLPADVRGQALGFVAMFTMLGAALGPVVGGFLTSAFSWRFIFYVNVPVGILAVILGVRSLPLLKPVSPQATLDKIGIILIFVALGTLIYGLTTLQSASVLIAIGMLIVSFIFWILFYIWEHRTSEPLIDFHLFKNHSFTLQNINILIIQLCMAGVMILMPFYLELVKGIGTDSAGTILLALPIGTILTSPIAGRISDVIGTKKPIIIGFIICIIALFFLSTLSVNSSIGHAEVYLFILGAGTGFAYAPLNSAVMGLAPSKVRGEASGLIKMMTNLGSSLGIALVMLVTTTALGPKIAEIQTHTLPAKDIAYAFNISFLFLMFVELIGIILMFLIKDKKSEYTTNGEPVGMY